METNLEFSHVEYHSSVVYSLDNGELTCSSEQNDEYKKDVLTWGSSCHACRHYWLSIVVCEISRGNLWS
jgi:hypothetical protein